MKWIIFFTFTLNNILFVNVSFAQALNQEEIEKERFKQEAQSIYSAVNISSIVPFDQFFKGYVGYFKYKNKLNGIPIITFINYSMPSNQPRMVTVDFKAKSTPFVSHVAHGLNSSAEAAGSSNACQLVTEVSVKGIAKAACTGHPGLPAVSFSDEGGSLKSALGFVLVGGYNMGEDVGKSLRLSGLETDNSGFSTDSRAVLYHMGNYVESGGSSWGCIAVPPGNFEKGYEILKNNTLIYIFAANNTVLKAEAVNEEELKEAVVASKDANYTATPDVSNVKQETTAFKDLEVAKSPPSNGGLLLGLAAIGGAVALGMSMSSSKPSEPLTGSPKYEECQKHSDTTWEKTVTDINKGENPSNHFRGSWNELHQTMVNESVENGPAIQKANERVAVINDCVATAHISGRTNFQKENINQPEKKSTADGSITCVYGGPESQDYQACLETISAHDSLLKQEVATHEKQASDFKTSSEKRVGQVKGDNAQAEALAQFSGIEADHSNIATERADISSKKIDQLSAVASRIPTTDSLYDECSAKFAKHGTVSVNEYNQFVKIYSGTPKSFSAERDYCLAAVTNGVKPIHNQNAREEVKKVLKSFGREMDEYTSKSSALLKRTALTPGLSDSSFGMALTDLKFNSGGNTNSGGSFKGYASEGLMLNNSGRSDGSNGAGGGAFLGRTNGIGGQGAANSGIGAFGSVGGTQGNVGGYNDSGAMRGSNVGSGIYNEEFDRRINMALQNPGKLAVLKLTPAEMKEYLERKNYNELMAKGASEIGGRTPASSNGVIKDETPLAVSDKDLNIFEIISTRYAKKFFEGL